MIISSITLRPNMARSIRAIGGKLLLRFATLGVLSTLFISGHAADVVPVPSSLPALGALSEDVQDLARRVYPCVVKVVAVGYLGSDENNGSQGAVSLGQSSGSGLIIDPNGYIVTNAHVLGGADHAQVTLPASGSPAGRERGTPQASKTLRAQIVGVDLEADIALLKVPDAGLPFLPLTPSPPVRQGQVVLAFGGPMGLEDSVSLGVVSSTERQLDPEDTIAYIQTDASINPGSSGGPLLNAAGQLVGINTLILSLSGGSEGLGFAVPVDLVKVVVERLRREGRAIRADVGLSLRTVNPTLAAAWGLPAASGVLVQDVEQGGPARGTGIRPGDLIASLDGQPLVNLLQLNIRLYGAVAGSRLQLGILRDGQRVTVPVKVRERESATSRIASSITKTNLISRLGIFVTDMDKSLSVDLGQARGEGGVLVAATLSDVPVLGEDFKVGDIIYRMNRHRISDSAQLRELVDGMKEGDPIAFQVEREGQLRFVATEIP